MKNYKLFAIIIIALLPIGAMAQIDITGTVGYNFGAKLSVYGGEIKMKGATTYGAKLDFFIDEETSVNFIYTNTPTRVTIRDWSSSGNGGIETDFSDVTANYFMLGAARYFGYGEMFQPYANFNLGGAYYTFTNVNTDYVLYDSTPLRFAIGFGLGAKVMFSERIGLDVHIRALAPITWGGVGIGVGTGGASAGAYVGSSFISGDVGGGLIIRLGE